MGSKTKCNMSVRTLMERFSTALPLALSHRLQAGSAVSARALRCMARLHAHVSAFRHMVCYVQKRDEHAFLLRAVSRRGFIQDVGGVAAASSGQEAARKAARRVRGVRPQKGLPREQPAREDARRGGKHVWEECVVLLAQVREHHGSAARQLRALQRCALLLPQTRVSDVAGAGGQPKRAPPSTAAGS